MKIDYVEAITAIDPNASYEYNEGIGGNERRFVWWKSDKPQPTNEEIDVELNKLQAKYDSLAYARKRKEEYDALNQFELMTDDAINGTTTHLDAINEIKKKYPKG